MRKLIFVFNMSLDGFIDHTAMIADAELHKRTAAIVRAADLMLYGRVCYQLMVPYWPEAEKDPATSPSELEFARAFNPIRKIVYSTTLKEAGANTQIVPRVDRQEVEALKAAPGGDILLGGGAIIARQFLGMGLVDEMRLIVHPVLVGGGKRLFAEDGLRHELKLIGRTEYGSGVMELVYSLKGN